ncbi:hypothetical protein DAY19_13795 [Halobacteriovorax vibrionivorans]|uniref:Uncharacterized protein n=1 Tax=Halobacteriovorax vibrionivorans TaxID=2152716 RepID=A0ABY0IDL3_9BACT|nr:MULTISPECIES: hypothetical protein [Halobacteriovorax]RZF21047.1 hypothetical protein DAY19_13795 [Halobacteriovorax vibrionivorans]TGD48062.1 hypothetical protein EP118_05405 [Halobacteriovorax sp. Y22]
MKRVAIIIFLLVTTKLMAFDLGEKKNEDISDVQFDVVRSFDILDPDTGYSHRIDAPKPGSDKKIKVRVVGQNSWAYRIKLEIDGVEQDKVYQVTKRYLKQALDMASAYNYLRLNRTIGEVGKPPVAPCIDGEAPRPVFVDEIFEEPKNIVTSNEQWKPGCEVLEDRSKLSSEDSEQRSKLGQCIRSIQNSITRQGSLGDRGQIFRNLYRYLRPEEQHFAAMVFTAQGEAGILARDINGGDRHPEEMMMIMKVINNRVRNANDDAARRGREGDKTALDIALDPMQFSMYNQGEDNWRQMTYPGRNQEFETAIDAYMKFGSADFKPKPDVDHVYHYHANWMLPTDGAWGEGFRANQDNWELNVKVNDNLLRQPNPMYNENNASDRRKIARSWKRQRHIFYKPIDTDGQIVDGDDWHWTVKTPFRS